MDVAVTINCPPQLHDKVLNWLQTGKALKALALLWAQNKCGGVDLPDEPVGVAEASGWRNIAGNDNVFQRDRPMWVVVNIRTILSTPRASRVLEYKLLRFN